MFAQGEILTGVAQQAILIPSGAVYRGATPASDSYVFVVDAARRRGAAGPPRPGTDGKLEITDGLKPGDAAVAEQQIELADGVR